MKILYLDHPQFDLGSFNLYMGLCELIGNENIVVFPQKKLYFGEIDDYSGGYSSLLRKKYLVDKNEPLPAGIPPFAPNEDLINGYPNTRELPYLVTQSPHTDYTEEQVVDMIRAGAFAFIVLASSNRVNTIALARMRDNMGGLSNFPPIIYVDNGERDEMNEHWAHVFHPKIIFKLILTPQIYEQMKKKYGWELHSLPQSSCLAGKDLRPLLSKNYMLLYNKPVPDYVTLNGNDKCFDIYYAMGPTYGPRKMLADAITEYLKGKSAYIGISTPGHYHKYLNYIAHSKISVTMRGSGRDTARYWDIPLFNTVMMCDGTMGCIHPYPFEHQKTALFYDENNLNTIAPLLDYYLENDSERERIARAGHEHLMKYHTNKARAEYFLDIVNRELK